MGAVTSPDLLAARPRPSWLPTGRLRTDLAAFVSTTSLIVLLGAPAGLLWAALAPRLTVTVTPSGDIQADDLESTKAFIGADGTYLLVVLGLGLLCGTAAWFLARRHGPATVLGLTVGGVLAGLVAQRVGVQLGAHDAIEALRQGSTFRGTVDLYLGRKDQMASYPSFRSHWAAIGWPLGALVAFLVPAWRRPEELD